MKSIWEDSAHRPSFNTLKGNKECDVLIIGGGIAGILCAYKLKKSGGDCMLVEAKEICSGITANTTAKITVGHGLIYDGLISRFGKDGAQMYLRAQMDAAKEYEDICSAIDCDYEVKDSYVFGSL